MGLLILFLLWYNLCCKNNPDSYKRTNKNFWKIVVPLVILGVLSHSSIFGIFTIFFSLALAFGAPVIVIIAILSALGMIGNKNKRSISNEADRLRYEQFKNNQQRNGNAYTGNRGYGNVNPYSSSGNSQTNNSRYGASYGGAYQNGKRYKGATLTGLTKSFPKRRKIVEKFNKKYGLNLRPEEIERIVDASYMSYSWEREICDMDDDYQIIAEWFTTDTSWLRAYLRVFSIQTVSSDFGMQKDICLSAFGQIFEEIDPANCASVEECIYKINNRYMTAFDETTFMIAYRFLQANGYKVVLPGQNLVRNKSDIENLMDKYDGATDANVAYSPEQARNNMSNVRIM